MGDREQRQGQGLIGPTTQVRIETEDERIEREERERIEREEREVIEAIDQLLGEAIPEGETDEERITREEREEEEMDRLARAMRQHSKNVVYKDYGTKQDFTLWLQGFREKIRSQYGYPTTQAGDDEVNAEVIRLISGRLEPGTPLDTYNRLSATVKANYNQLVENLTTAFTDPQAKRNFLKDFGYDKRKKGQTIHEFMQVVMNNQNRFGDMPDKIEVGGASVPNRAKVKDGIRRFMTGMRDRRGKKNKSLMEVLDFNLMEDVDFTWENAILSVVRWENSHPMDTDSDSSSSSSSSEEEEPEEDKKKKKKKSKGKEKPAEAALELASVKTEMSTGIATLADKVEANTRDIKGIKSQQERTEVNMAAWKAETSSSLSQLLQGQQQLLQAQQQRFRSPFPQQQYRPPLLSQPQSFPQFQHPRPGRVQYYGGQSLRNPTPPPAAPVNMPAPAAAPATDQDGATADNDAVAQQRRNQQVNHQFFEHQQQEQLQHGQQQFEQQQHLQQAPGQYFDDGSQSHQEGYMGDVMGALNRWNFG